MAALRTATVAQLWNITERLNLLHPANWTREVQPLIQAATFLSGWELNPQAMFALQSFALHIINVLYNVLTSTSKCCR
jgi:hypothetical protein